MAPGTPGLQAAFRPGSCLGHEDLCVLQEKLSGEARLPLSPVSFPLSSSGSALSLAASVSLSAQIMDW